nr:pyridoxamine 5'-phosphate oxidase family protein [Paracraurococcus ruber]
MPARSRPAPRPGRRLVPGRAGGGGLRERPRPRRRPAAVTPVPALPELRAEAFRLLSRGVADRRSAFHTPTLATIGPDGAPQLRTLVLRGFDPAARALRLHTDRRSAKWSSLAGDARAALHVYDPGAQIQLRLSGTASRHAEDEVADAAWFASQPGSRLCYSVSPGPGTPVPAPPAAPRADAGGRAHFGVLRLVFDRLEFLHLHHAGHRRARFAWGTDWVEETWLVP